MRDKLIEILDRYILDKTICKPRNFEHAPRTLVGSIADEIINLILEDIDTTQDWDAFYMELTNEHE